MMIDFTSLADSIVLHTQRRLPSPAAARWTTQELETLRAGLGYTSEEEIAQRLPGRSVVAVKLKRQRTAMPATSKATGWITATSAIRMIINLSDQRIVSSWVRKGLILGHFIQGQRNVCMVHEVSLRRFIVSPANWVYFNPDKVIDPGLMRLIAIQKQRWQDEWLTTRQAADLLGIKDVKEILRNIQLGRIQGVKLVNKDGRKNLHDEPAWSYWMVRKSEALKLKRYRYGEAISAFTDQADTFIILAAAIGLSAARISRLVGINNTSVSKRLQYLMDEQAQELAAQYNGKVHLNGSKLLADWRQFPKRFPHIERAAKRFAAGNPQKDDLYLLALILSHQAEWHGIHLSKYGRVSIQRIEKMADRLRAQQIEPYL
ncbi:MAG: hypothetical protein QM706_17710 [Nitrospira sp.]